MNGARPEVVRYRDRPALWDDMPDIGAEVWPEYNRHGDVLNRYWGRLYDSFPAYQFVLYDEQHSEVVAEGHAAPCAWDGTIPGLGDGIDEMIVAAFEAHSKRSKPTALCALAAEIRPHHQGGGLAVRMLDVMAEFARESGLAHLIAPVRPSLKERYPLTPIGSYVRWTREDGQPFDPWIRIHVRRGGKLVKPVPRSLQITGTVAEWERWTEMRFPDDGQYTFPRGLATLEIDHEHDLGSYWEPNVWIVHAIT
jgi:GNAT superfamily N-acetyltransferase